MSYNYRRRILAAITAWSYLKNPKANAPTSIIDNLAGSLSTHSKGAWLATVAF